MTIIFGGKQNLWKQPYFVGLSENAIIYVKVYVRLPQSDITCLKKIVTQIQNNMYLSCLLPNYQRSQKHHCVSKQQLGDEEKVGKGKINLASHEYFRFDPNQHWYKRGCCLGFHTPQSLQPSQNEQS